MRQPTFYAAVFGIIRNEKGEILFSRRSNTGHLDGYLSLPAGHVEIGETITEAMLRELSEEIGIVTNDIVLTCVQQSTHQVDKKTYCNFFFEVNTYIGNVENLEPEKCSECIFLSPKNVQNELCVPYVIAALEAIEAGESLSELTWNT